MTSFEPDIIKRANLTWTHLSSLRVRPILCRQSNWPSGPGGFYLAPKATRGYLFTPLREP